MATRTPRLIKPYPYKPKSLLRRLKRGAIKWQYLRQPRPRTHARNTRLRPLYDQQAALEARAVPTWEVYGSLEERIFYKALTDRRFIPGVDFSFQAAQLGGRAELGGLVADFVFEIPKVIVNPSSVWHTMTLENVRRDEDQSAILQALGYTQIMLDPEIIHDSAALDYWMSRNVMTLWGTSTQGIGSGGNFDLTYLESITLDMYNHIYLTLEAIAHEVRELNL